MLKRLLKRIPESFGYELRRRMPPDLSPEFLAIHNQASTLGGPSIGRNFAMYCAVRHIVKHHVPGDIVECGVLRGASCLLAALTLKQLSDTSRRIHLYDTYRGMSEPTERDVDASNRPAMLFWKAAQRADHNEIAYCPLPQVQQNMRTSGYPFENFVFIEGKVEDTIPASVPERIALLRLDTDWYQSTYHEMVHLYPRLSRLGMLIIDDYGAWQGARQAVDQYFEEHNVQMFLARVDETGRVGMKV